MFLLFVAVVFQNKFVICFLSESDALFYDYNMCDLIAFDVDQLILTYFKSVCKRELK